MTPRRHAPKVVLIGAGRVGFHLGQALFEQKINITQVFSRQLEKATFLAQKTNAVGINDLTQVAPDADLYILAVKDDAIETVGRQIAEICAPEGLVVHTSGATPGVVFAGYFRNFGVFYPLQTFSMEKTPDFTQIPICVDANSPKNLAFLQSLAQKLSPLFYHISDAQRAWLHVAAVFVNNFSNFMYYIGEKILDEENMTLEILKPLIAETAQKVQTHSPRDMQTGPAIRGETTTIRRHLALLEKHPEFRALYEQITRQIQQNLL